MNLNLEAFLEAFFEESAELLATLESGLLRVEKGHSSADLVDELFRAAHTLKGNAATFGFRDVVSVTHRLETLLAQARESGGRLDQRAVGVMISTVDGVGAMMACLRENRAVPPDDVRRLIDDLQQLGDRASGSPPEDANPASIVLHPGWRITLVPREALMRRGNDPILIFRALESLGTLNVEVDLSNLPGLDDLQPASLHVAWTLVLEGDVPRDLVEEMFDWVLDDCDLTIEPLTPAATSARGVQAPSASAHREGEGHASTAVVRSVQDGDPEPFPPAGRGPAAADEEVRPVAQDANAVRIAVDKVDRLINLVGQLSVTRSVLDRLVDELPDHVRAQLSEGLHDLARHTRDLQDSVLEIRMLPLSFVTRRLPRVVRDISRTLGKEVDLKVIGEDTELDKSVLERISDPLMHIVRNCLDHGMETPAERVAKGKPPRGRVEIRAGHQQGRVVVEIADDGPGIDTRKVLDVARRRGIVGQNEDLSRDRALDLVFSPGLSTANAVSEVSGRGVGLDVVRQNVYALGGSLEVESTPGTGTCFTMRLPLTLAIIDGQFVRAGREVLVLPLVSIVECLPVDPAGFRSMGGRRGLYRFRDTYIPVARLDHLLDMGNPDLQDGRVLVVVEWGSERRGLIIDALLEQQQVVVKSLERNFRDIDGIIGGALLGDGSIGLIVDVAGLVRRRFVTMEGPGPARNGRREGMLMTTGNAEL